MKIRHVIWLLGALLLLLVLISLLVLLVRGEKEWRKLEQDWQEGLQKFQVFLDEDPRRPVLRGEARPGDGGGELAALLKEVGGALEMEQLSKFRAMVNGSEIPPDDLSEAKEAEEVLRAQLPRLREAIQHESCRLPVDLTLNAYVQFPDLSWQTLGLSDALMLEAEELAASGRRREALANVADTIRVGHDLGRKTGMLAFKFTGAWVEENAIRSAGTILHSHPFTAEELASFAGELAILASTRPTVSDCFAMEEYSFLFNISPPLGIPGKVTFAAKGGLGLDLYHSRYRRFVEIYEMPITELREAALKFEEQPEDAGLVGCWQPSPRGIKESVIGTQTLLACLRAAVMVHILRAEHEGAWPADLPLDPWDGRPLRFKAAEGDRPDFIYSVGANLVDDGGVAPGPYQHGVEGAATDTIFPLAPWPNP